MYFGYVMSKHIDELLQHVRLLTGRALIRRDGRGYFCGDVLSAHGSDLAGKHVSFARAEATFQKGKTHYAIALIRNCQRA